jgi:hypothetical protein
MTVIDRDTSEAGTAPRRSMVPADSALPDVLPTDRINAKGVMARPWRDELRRIPTARNAVTVVAAVAQTYGVVAAAAVVNTWWAWLAAFALMGRGHALLNILGHEAAHRLLFPDRRVNDVVGRWVLGFATFQPFGTYRRSHFAHHRDEMGPDEPDLSLYNGYPISKASWHRKLRRDAPARAATRTSVPSCRPPAARRRRRSRSSSSSSSCSACRSPCSDRWRTWCGSARG